MLIVAATLLLVAPGRTAHADLVSYWTFDGDWPYDDVATGGFWPDYGTPVGTVSTAPGIFGSGLSLAGNGSLNVGSGMDFDTSTYTVSTWLRPTAVGGGWYTAFGAWGAPSFWAHFGLDSSGRFSDFYRVNGAVDTEAFAITPTANTWYHVVSIKTSSTLQVYVNAVAGNQVTGLTGGAMGPGDLDVFIGSRDAAANFWRGGIDDVGVWNEELTAGKVQSLYKVVNSGLAPLRNYSAGAMAELFAAYDWQSSATVGDLTWEWADGFTGHQPGDVWVGNGAFHVQLGESDGMTAPVPTTTWTGGALPGDNAWQTPENWGGTAPLPGSNVLVFGTANVSNHNDFPDNTPFIGISFASTAGAFNLGGNVLNLSAEVVNHSANKQTISMPLVVEGLAFSVNAAAGDIELAGPVGEAGGSRGLTKTGAGKLILSAANTYSGPTTVDAGSVQLAHVDALPNSTVQVNVNSGLTFAPGQTAAAVGGLSGSGNLVLQTAAPGPQPVALTVGANNANTTFSGALSGPGSLTKTGTARLHLAGANTHSGGTNAQAGYLVFDDASAVSPNGTITAAAGAYAGAAFSASQANFINRFNKAATSGVIGLEANPDGAIDLTGFHDAVRLGTRTSATLEAANPLTPAGNTFRLGGGGGILTVKTPLTGDRSLEIGASDSLPAGTVAITAAATYTGATNITAGTLRLGERPALPSVGATNTVWLDAMDVSGNGSYPNNGAAVNTWVNKAGGTAGSFIKSGTGNATFTASSSAFSNKPVVHFDGNEVLQNSTNFGNNFTLFYVGKMTGTLNARLVSGLNSNWLVGYWGGKMNASYWNNRGNYQGTVAADTNPHIWAASADGANYYAFRNDGAGAGENQFETGALGNGSGPNGLSLGGYGPGERSAGDIAELLVYNGALSAADRAAVEDYLAAKWFASGGAGSTNLLPATTAVNISDGAVLDVNGINQTIASLAGTSGANVVLGGGTLTVGDAADTEFAGTILGGGTLIKTGTGTWTLAGNSTFGGTTTVSAGTLRIGNGGTTGALTSNITDNAAVAFDRADVSTHAGAISGSGQVYQLGTGVLALTGANTYNGATTVSAGVLRANDRATAAAPAGVPAASNVTLGDGVWESGNNILRSLGTGAGQMQILGGTSGFSAFGAPIQINLAGGANVKWGTAAFSPDTLVLNAPTANNTLDFQNVLDLNTAGLARTIAVYAGTASMSQGISDTGSGAGLTKTGAGVLHLAGLNTYGGPTTVNAGVLRGNDPLTSGMFGVPAGTNMVLNGGVWESGNSISRTLGTASGQVQIPGGASGFSAYGVAPVTISLSGGVPLVWDPASHFNPDTLVLNAASANQPLEFQNALDLKTAPDAPRTLAVHANAVTLSGVLSDSGANAGLAKTGNGTLVLSATSGNTFTGPTTLLAGKLVLSRAAADGTTLLGNVRVNTPNAAWTTRAGVELGADEQLAPTSILTLQGSGDQDWSGFRPMGHLQTLGGLVSENGTGVVENTSINAAPYNAVTTDGTLVLRVAEGQSYTFAGFLRNSDGGPGKIHLVKEGNGTQTLGNAAFGNRVVYSGTTTINAGTLRLEHTTAFQSPITVNSGGTLEFASALPFKGWMFNQPLNGGGTVNKTGPGDIRVYGLVNLSGQINIQQGELGNDNLTSNWTACTANMNIGPEGRFDLRGDNVNINSLNGAGTIYNSYGRPPAQGSQTNILTVGVVDGDGEFSGTLRDSTSLATGADTGRIAVTKAGAGTQTLRGANITYHGPTTVNAGTLRLADTSNFNSPITNNAALELAAETPWTLAQPIGGTGGIQKTGAGTVTLTAASTYGGPTTISGGTLRMPQPAAAPLAGSVLWLDAADSSAESVEIVDGMVAAWNDKSGVGNDLTQPDPSMRPVYTTSGDTLIHGKNVITIGGNPLFGESPKYLSNPSFNMASPYTVFTVAQTLGADPFTWQTLLDGDNALGPYVGVDNSGNRVSYGTTGGTVTTDAEVWSITTSSATSDNLWVNGEKQTLTLQGGGYGTAGYSGGLRIGLSGNNTTSSWNGTIGEVLIYPGVLSDAQRQEVESYLLAKWLGTAPWPAADLLPSTTAVDITAAGAALDLNGNHQTIASLAGVGGSKVLLGAGTLTVAGDGDPTEFAGDISGDGALAKTGASALTLSGSNDYAGGTVVSGGTLEIGSANALPAGGSLHIGEGGTVVLGGGLSTAASAASASSPAAVPEPGTLALLAAVMAALLGAWRRRPV